MRPRASGTSSVLRAGRWEGVARRPLTGCVPRPLRGERSSAKDGPAGGAGALLPRDPPAAHALLWDPRPAGPGLRGTPRPGSGDSNRWESGTRGQMLGS